MYRMGQRRRLAAIFLGLFLGLLAMVTLHDFSHRADDVQAVSMSSSQELTTHVDQTGCVLCQFVHTPFLALALGVALLASVLGVRLLGTRLESIWSYDYLCLAQLRAPPADTLA